MRARGRDTNFWAWSKRVNMFTLQIMIYNREIQIISNIVGSRAPSGPSGLGNIYRLPPCLDSTADRYILPYTKAVPLMFQ
jgi:hypothetical protein